LHFTRLIMGNIHAIKPNKRLPKLNNPYSIGSAYPITDSYSIIYPFNQF
jgi:hypothetical protein